MSQEAENLETGPEPSGTEQLEALNIEDNDFRPDAGDVSEPEPEKAKPKTSEMLLMVIGPGFDIVAPNWKVTDQEKQMLSEAYGDLIDYYWPDMDMGPIGGAIACTALVVIPRMKTPRKIEPETEEDGNQS